MPLEPGQSLAHFRLVEKIGEHPFRPHDGSVLLSLIEDPAPPDRSDLILNLSSLLHQKAVGSR